MLSLILSWSANPKVLQITSHVITGVFFPSFAQAASFTPAGIIIVPGDNLCGLKVLKFQEEKQPQEKANSAENKSILGICKY